VTIAADAGSPDGRVVVDARGRELARFREGARDGIPLANDFSLIAPPEAAVDGNPAHRLYEAHGFAEVSNLLTVEL